MSVPRLLAIRVAAALAVGLLATPSVFAAADPASQIAFTFQASVNAHDVEGAARLFADDAIVMQPRIGGLPQTYVGRDQIHWWLRNLAAQNAHLDMAAAPRLTGSQLRWSDSLTLDAFRELGLEPLVVESDAVLASDGRIESLQMTLTPDSARRVQLAPGLPAAQSSADSFPMAGGLTAEVLALMTVGLGASVLLTMHLPGMWRSRPPQTQVRARSKPGVSEQTSGRLDGAPG